MINWKLIYKNVFNKMSIKEFATFQISLNDLRKQINYLRQPQYEETITEFNKGKKLGVKKFRSLAKRWVRRFYTRMTIN